MRLTRLEIQSFRSIGRCEWRFGPPEADDADLWVIVGENNAGKSTVLNALEWLLGDRRQHPAPVRILHDYTVDGQWAGRFQRLRLVATDGDGRTWRRVWTLPQGAAPDGHLAETQGSCVPERNRLITIEPHPSRYLDQLRLPSNPDSLTVWRLIRDIVSRDYRSQEDLLAHLTRDLRGIPGVYDIRWPVLESAGEWPSSADGLEIHDGTWSALCDKGPGLQKLVLLSLVEWASAQNTPEPWMLAWDEPEAHLHPQMVRQLAHRLHEVAHRRHVLCATHAPYLVQVAGLDHVVRISNRGQSARLTGWPVYRAWRDTADGKGRYRYADAPGGAARRCPGLVA